MGVCGSVRTLLHFPVAHESLHCELSLVDDLRGLGCNAGSPVSQHGATARRVIILALPPAHLPSNNVH